MANKKIWMGILVMTLVFGMTIIGCNDKLTDDDGSTGGGGSTYTVSYNVGTGSGTAPSSQTVNAGQTIYLPNHNQGNMSPPSGNTFNGWRTGDVDYSAGDAYKVIGNVTFTAQWRSSGTNVNVKSIKMTGLDDFIGTTYQLGLANSVNDLQAENLVAYVEGTINTGTQTATLLDYLTDMSWTGSGSFYVGVRLKNESYVTTSKISFNSAITTLSIDDFEEAPSIP